MKRLSLIAISLGAACMASTSALAEERVCRGTIGAVTLDNVRVPQNTRCDLNGTRVKGTVKVEAGATLVADDVVVIGNVQAENHRRVVVRDGSRIGGSVQIKQGGSASVADSRVEADIQYDENNGVFDILRNVVGGNVQAIKNSGELTIRRNRIDGNLQCKENSPSPVGGSNTVQGNKEDQCRRL
jgi:hypothetical protein